MHPCPVLACPLLCPSAARGLRRRLPCSPEAPHLSVRALSCCLAQAVPPSAVAKRPAPLRPAAAIRKAPQAASNESVQIC